MYQHILLDTLEGNPELYAALIHYFQRHPEIDYNVSRLLIYFASHQSSTHFTGLAEHLRKVLDSLEQNDTETFRTTVEDINAPHPIYEGNSLLHTLFERGLLLAIHTYIQHLPITLHYKNHKGNTILHQLSNACKNIFNYIYSYPLDDEIDDDSFLPYQITYATDILEYLKQERETIDLLTKESKYIFNAEGESALGIFLRGYNSSLYVDFEDFEEIEVPFLNDLLIVYPKEIIINTYQDFCVDPHNFSNQFLKNMLKEALLQKDTVVKRFQFHHDNFAEHIFESDLNPFKKLSLPADRVRLILSHLAPQENQNDSREWSLYCNNKRNNSMGNLPIQEGLEICIKKKPCKNFIPQFDKQRSLSWIEDTSSPSKACSPQAHSMSNIDHASTWLKSPTCKSFLR